MTLEANEPDAVFDCAWAITDSQGFMEQMCKLAYKHKCSLGQLFVSKRGPGLKARKELVKWVKAYFGQRDNGANRIYGYWGKGRPIDAADWPPLSHSTLGEIFG